MKLFDLYLRDPNHKLLTGATLRQVYQHYGDSLTDTEFSDLSLLSAGESLNISYTIVVCIQD